MNDISVVIPAAGAGRRMKSYGPKSLIKVGNSTIINSQIGTIKSHIPKCDIVLVCGFKAEKLMNETPENIIKIENELYEESNVVRSIGMGLRATANSSTVMLVYGDLVFNSEAISHLIFDRSCIVIDQETMADEEVGCVIGENGNLENIMYDLPNKWGQIAVFIGTELQLLKELCWDKKNYRKFGFEIINSIMDRGGKFKCIDNEAIKIIDIDNSKDIGRAAKVLL